MLSDYEIVQEILGDPDRQERMRLAVLDMMRKDNGMRWACDPDSIKRAADEVIKDALSTHTPNRVLADICRSMFPFRHATGDN